MLHILTQLHFSDIVSSHCSHVDPPDCESNEELCPGPKDENGCEGESKCTASEGLDNFGTPCPVICQPICSLSEVLCPGIKDSNGCNSKGTCVKSDIIVTNGVICEPQCPIRCTDNQTMCSGQYDTNGCKSEDYCIDNEGTAILFSAYAMSMVFISHFYWDLT